MYPDDRGRSLHTVIAYLVGDRIKVEDLYRALDVSKSTYHERESKGTLLTADNLVTVARAFGINPIELLTRFRLVGPEEVAELAEGADTAIHPTATTTRKEVTKPRTRNERRLETAKKNPPL